MDRHGTRLALPLYQPTAHARSARAVGNDALQIEFTGGHSTGIFSFAYLREICPCPACRSTVQAGGSGE